MKIRKPAHSGRFYPAHKKDIVKLYESILLSEQKQINYQLSSEKLIGAIVPHAGFVYSGYQAIHVFEILKKLPKKIDSIIIINPNHTGYGPEIAIDENDAWETPQGIVKLDQELIDALKFERSEAAHRHEHSAEVMIPFLQYVLGVGFQIVPITLSVQNVSNAKRIASSLNKAISACGKNTFIIASSDFSHFLSPERGHQMDDFVLHEIYDLNAAGIEKQVTSKNISVCGFGPIMSLIEYSKLVSSNPKISLLKRGHSGEVHPSNEVVDYISMMVYE